MDIRKYIHPILLGLMKTKKYEIQVLNKRPDIHGNVIYAVNHSTKHDMPIVSEIIGDYAWVLVGKQRLNVIDRICFWLNGVIWVDRKNKTERAQAKSKMILKLQEGISFIIFPEGTWNLEPSKPMLPLYWGIIDIAREAKRPVVPLVLEYRDNRVLVKWGEPIKIGQDDDKKEKINELSAAMATLKWEIWESLPRESRNTVDTSVWENEVRRRLSEYPKLDCEYEKSCMLNI